MEKEEYKRKLKELEEEHKKKRSDLFKEYALSNNPYKKGDILQDSSSIILVDIIKVTVGLYEDPSCIYIGPELKKDLSPKKNGNIGSIYQGNMNLKKLN